MQTHLCVYRDTILSAKNVREHGVEHYWRRNVCKKIDIDIRFTNNCCLEVI